jgi:DNA polymerase II small subunit
MSINRIVNKTDRETVSLIGMVKDKNYTKNGNLMLVLEDPTGCIKTLISKTKMDLYNTAKDIVLDEVIGIVGANGQNIVFANNVIWPDLPIRELKKSPDEIYALFLSDLHVGSKQFLPNEFNKFLQWINGKTGTSQQREIASKIKYIFIIGDLVDGCGIYPEQDTELLIKDIYKQYEECATLLKQIPFNIKLIICPGNHDAMRIAEPQPELYKDFAKSIWELPNVNMVSNPALINIHSSDKFSGFDILIYHGYSFDYYVANVDSIRNRGGYDRADLIMSFLLQRRHLAPTHKSTLYIPDTNKDPLVIEQPPDFFITGHIHKSIAANYKNVTLICGSCWQSKTSFQEKVGHNPEPARIPLVNLQTRQIKILKF